MKKRLVDIRYYQYDAVPAAGVSARESDRLGSLSESRLDGKRIALMLRSKGFSIGTQDHLYLVFSRAVRPFDVQRVDFAPEPWFTYVAVGLPSSEKLRSAAKRYAFVRSMTFKALRLLNPGQSVDLRDVERELNVLDSRIKIPLLEKTSKNLKVSIFVTIPKSGLRSRLIVEASDLKTREIRGSHETTLRYLDDAPFLAGRILVNRARVLIVPRVSAIARDVAAKYSTPLVIDL